MSRISTNGNGHHTTKVPHPELNPLKLHRYEVVPISWLRVATYNPPSRTDPTDRRSDLYEMVEAYKVLGQVRPLVCTMDYDLIEGHRGRAAALMMGATHVTIVRLSEKAELVFRLLNATQKQDTTNDHLHVYLHGAPNAINEKTRAELDNIKHYLGKAPMKKACEAKLSLAMFRQAKRLINLCCGGDLEGMFVTVVKWVIKFRGTRKIRVALEAGNYEGIVYAIFHGRDYCEC